MASPSPHVPESDLLETFRHVQQTPWPCPGLVCRLALPLAPSAAMLLLRLNELCTPSHKTGFGRSSIDPEWAYAYVPTTRTIDGMSPMGRSPVGVLGTKK